MTFKETIQMKKRKKESFKFPKVFEKDEILCPISFFSHFDFSQSLKHIGFLNNAVPFSVNSLYRVKCINFSKKYFFIKL